MAYIECFSRYSGAALYRDHRGHAVLCEHARSDVPYDIYTQACTYVVVHELDRNHTRTGRTQAYQTTSFDIAAMNALALNVPRVIHRV